MAEALARGVEDGGGLFHLVLFVSRRLGIFGQGCFFFLAHFVKLFLSFFKFPKVPAHSNTIP